MAENQVIFTSVLLSVTMAQCWHTPSCPPSSFNEAWPCMQLPSSPTNPPHIR